MKKGQYEKAYKSLVRLRNSKLQAARDLYYVHAQLRLEKEIIGHNNYFTRFFELFTIPRVRRATLASFVVMLAQQMCGSRCRSWPHVNPFLFTFSQYHCVLFVHYFSRSWSWES